MAVGEEGAIGRHEPPSLAELVIPVLSQKLGEALDVEHVWRRVEVEVSCSVVGEWAE